MVSFLSHGLFICFGYHLSLFRQVLALLRERGAEHVVVFGGGIIPEGDITALKGDGVRGLFTPGASLAEITGWLEAELDSMHASAGREPQSA